MRSSPIFPDSSKPPFPLISALLIRLLTSGMSMNTSTALSSGFMFSASSSPSKASSAAFVTPFFAEYSRKRGVLYITWAEVSNPVTRPFSSTRTRKCCPLPQVAVMVEVSPTFRSVYS